MSECDATDGVQVVIPLAPEQEQMAAERIGADDLLRLGRHAIGM